LANLPDESVRAARLQFTLNGEAVDVSFAPYKTLLEVLREDLAHTGTKHGCELGECGACAVLLDGKPVLSCLVLALECDGREVLTVEGLTEDGKLHPLQDAPRAAPHNTCKYSTGPCGVLGPGALESAPCLQTANAHHARNGWARGPSEAP